MALQLPFIIEPSDTFLCSITVNVLFQCFNDSYPKNRNPFPLDYDLPICQKRYPDWFLSMDICLTVDFLSHVAQRVIQKIVF